MKKISDGLAILSRHCYQDLPMCSPTSGLNLAQCRRTFKVAHQNLLTTRTMDDEDAPGLKALLTFKLVALDNSVEGMEVVCQEIEATSKDPEGHSVDDLIAEFSSSCLSAKVSKTFHISQSSKSCEYVLNTLMQVIRRDAVFLRFQVIVLQLEFLMLKDNEAKVLNVSDAIEEDNEFDATSSDLTELEANEDVNDGDVEVLTDVESTSGIDARDQASELETKVLVDGKQDGAEVVGVADEQNSNEPDVLENNGVIGVGVNENNEGSKGILEDVPEVNKKAAHVIIENSENGVSSDADLDETVIHIRVNGDSVDHRTQPDGEISGEVNGDQLHEDVNGKDALVTDDNDDDSVKQNDEVESTTNDLLNAQNEQKVEQNKEVVPKRFTASSSAIHEPEVERQPSFDDKVSESVADSSEIREQKDEDNPLNKEPESRPVIGVSLSTAKSVAPTPTAVPNPKDDPKPKETPTPNSRPNTPPTLRPFLAPVLTRPAGLGRGAPLLEPAHLVAQSQANGNVSPPQNQVIDEPTNGEAEENDETREKLQMIRVKFLRLARRLGQTHNVVVAQVLYRLGLVEQLRGRGRVAAFSFERASAMADIEFELMLFNWETNEVQDVLELWQDIFGQSIWFNAIVVLTHAASAPPECPKCYTIYGEPLGVLGQYGMVKEFYQIASVGPHLLLLSFASKILVEANMLLKLQDSPPGKPFAARSRAPPLPYILSTLLQSRPQMKLPQEQFGDDNDDALDDDIDESSDEESSEYDELPPFKRLTNAQLSKLSKEQKMSYYDKLEYRGKLFMKKQLKEEKKRRKMMKKMAEAAKIFPTELTDNNDNPTHRYRALDSANQWLIRPVLDPHGWDHDVGYEGINVEHLLALKEKIPVSYSLRSETRFISYRKNKASAGLSATYFGDTLTGGVKFEDKLMINKRGELVVAEGAVIAHGDVAYGGSLEATLRDKDFPLGRFLSTIGLSVMDWHGDLALGWNAQSQIPIGRSTNLIGRVNLNNKGSGQVSVSLNSSDQLQIALAALVPLIEESYVVYAAGLQPVDAQHLVKLRGTAIKGHLSMVPIDMETQPIILAYIDVNLQTLAAARMLTPTGPTGQTHWGDSMANNPMPTAHSADA
ncbi:translocase of chloroplast 120, chloroplastic [Tanacetum coccineum]